MKTIDIIIRKETSVKLGLDTNPTFVRFLKTAIEDFCGYNFTDAAYVIFNLLYEDDKDIHNKVLKKFGFTLYSEDSFDPCVEYLFIEEDSVSIIAEELQFQYITANPRFLRVKEHPNCEQELLALKELLDKHPLLLYRAVESAWYSHKDSTLVQSCVYLLLSGKTESQLNGLEKLGHNHKHQQLLLPYSKEIGMLLKAMHTDYTEKQRVIAAQKELDALNKPFASLGKLLESKVSSEASPAINAVPAPKVASPVASEPTGEQDCDKMTDTPLSVETSMSPELSQFLSNTDALTFSIPDAGKFWEQLARLRKDIGIDLNFLVDNLEVVINVLSAHENLKTASDSLSHADHEHSVAMKRYTLDHSRDNLHLFVSAAKTYQEAKDIYEEAHESFVKHCNIFEKAVAKTS